MLHGRVGHYDVSDRLGGGGGGEVYRARDTLLDRPVAIKVLNPDALGDPRCLARFRREAQLAASLDHPYLCHVHELIEDGGTLLIVMEFVEGETLAERLSRGRLPLAEALQLGAELAEGLAAAHAHGLVHRDVKPSNVMVTMHQHVKLMDFGLARPVAAECSTRMPGDASTAPGEMVGTPHYMAPEQVSGDGVDARTDVFAFGLVLYECLAGRSPFHGESNAAHFESLLTGRRRLLADAVPSLPADVVGVVETCLAHDRTARFASGRVLAGEMRGLVERHGSERRAQPAPRPGGSRAGRVLAVAGLVAALAGGMAWLVPRGPRALPAPSSFEPLVTWETTERDAGVSPDGLWTSFVSNSGGEWRVWLRRTGGGDPRMITLPPGRVVAHGWSPGGAELAVVIIQDDAAWLHVVPAFFGGAPRATLRLPRANPFVRVAGWTGSTVFVELSSPTSLWRADLSSGAVAEIAAFRSAQGATADRRRQRDFAVDRAGERVLFTADALGHEDVWIARLDGSDRRVLTADAYGERSPAWLGDSGRFAYQSNRGGQVDVWVQELSSGDAGPVTASSAVEVPKAASRAGDLLVMAVHDERSNLWRIDPARGEGIPLTGDALNDAWPSTSAEGSLVVFQRTKSRSDSLYAFENTTLMAARLDASGLSAPRVVGEGYAARVSPDGRFVAAFRPSAVSRFLTELWVTDLETLQARRLSERVANGGFVEFPFDRGGDTVAWRADASSLVFLTSDEPASVCRWRPARWADPPERLAQITPPAFTDPQLALAPEGDGIALVAASDTDPGGALAIAHERGGPIERWRLPAGVGDVHLLGWRALTGAVLAARVERGSDKGRRMQVFEITARGAVELARWSDVSIASVHLGPVGETLIASRRERLEEGLYEYSLRSGRWRRLMPRVLPGVTFAGVECAGRAALVCARQEVKDDIWAMRLSVGGS